MVALTDPGCELAAIAEKLSTGGSENGDRYLASKFQVSPWSTEFVKIIACIYERADLVDRIVQRSNLDPDDKANCAKDIKEFKSAFAGESLHNPWNTAPRGGLTKVQRGSRLSYLQSTIRMEIAYPKLSDEEIAEFLELIDRYLQALERDGDGHPLVRQAIADGLTAFRFQLQWVRWTGAGYALSAFQMLINVYEQSRHSYATDSGPEESTAFAGLGKIIGAFAKKLNEAREYSDTAKWVWEGYKAIGALSLPALAVQHFPLLTGPG